jgi:serine/threonine protein kinase
MNVRLLIITQLTNALRYLESEKIVHRDIAARNCLIYPNYEIKLTNSALAAQEFQLHYLTLDGHHRLPIRWMAPETLTHVSHPPMNDENPCLFTVVFFRTSFLPNQIFGLSGSHCGK